MKLFDKAGALWRRMSRRERRLALMTLAAVAFFAGFSVFHSAQNRLNMLDGTLDRLHEDIVNYANQIVHREAVEALYGQVAAQHSSAWSEAEIRDRLRQEVYRLARNVPQTLDENGIPVNVPNESGNLVEIPSLGEGIMAEGGEGYRQYMLNLRIPPVPVTSLVAFLQRLQQSPQSLRIDKLELNRMPDSPLVAASIDITRTIADGSKTGPALSPESRSADVTAPGVPSGRIPLSASDWTGDGCAVALVDEDGGGSVLEIRAEREGGLAELLRKMPAGSVYEMNIELSADGPAVLAVGVPGAGGEYPNPEPLRADGGVYRYRVRFGVSGDGDAVPVACPRLVAGSAGAVVRVHNLLLRKIME
ncbi:MAG: hypothetical protein GX580_01200 [Candidatus Hydrogenedens sp.]|nr:hypothetical protein [Candidatus Hydrogenedentota bacterium]NLF56236.1 hypothetical protein [Candidatus Hydrogenedens sp.]